MLGIDISSTAVKLLELSQEGDRYKVENYAITTLPNDTSIGDSDNRPSAIGDQIRAICDRLNIRSKQVAAAVPSSSVIVKTIPMPAGLADIDLEAQIAFEADQHIPYPLDEVALDFQEQGPVPGASDQIDVLLVACRQQAVELRTDALASAGLVPVAIDVETFALDRAMSALQPQLSAFAADKVALLNVGATSSSLSVFVAGKSIYSREQMFDGKQLTDQMMSGGDPQGDALSVCEQRDQLEDADQEAVRTFRETVLQQVSRSLQLFFSTSDFDALDCIVLSGGVAATAGLSGLIEERLGIPTVVANPFTDMSIAPAVDKCALVNDAPAMMVACGLAMRSNP